MPVYALYDATVSGVSAKLFENRPASEVDVGHPRARLVVAGAVAVLVLGIVAGIWLIRSGDDTTATEPTATVELAAWAAAAGEVCERVADEHPVFASGPEARLNDDNIAAVDVAIQDLTSEIRSLTLPTVSEDAAAVAETLENGDAADLAWAALASGSPSPEEVGSAAALTDAYLASLADLGADCSMLN